jgi:Coenzyme PQQ synthesis protein D (PqqD)
VFAPSTGQAHLLNPTAALVLTAIDGRSTVGSIIDELARETGVDRSVLEGDVLESLGTFVRGGLAISVVGPSPPARPEGSTPDADADADADEDVDAADYWVRVIETRLDRVEWPQVLGPFQAVDAEVVVRTDREDMAKRLTAALTALPPASTADPSSASAVAPSSLTVDSRVVAGATRYRVHAGGERIGWVDDPDRAVGFALSGLNRLASARSGGRLLVHGGAVERDGRVVVITGASGRGKSTLTAALVQRGFGYLTDEIVVIGRGGQVEPYPKALEIDVDGLDRLGLQDDKQYESPADDDGAASLDRDDDGGAERHIPPNRLGRVADGGRIGLIVILDDPVIRGTEAVPVPAGEGMVHLLRDTFPATWAEPGALDAMADLCVAVPILRLPRLPVDSAAEILTGWLAEPSPRDDRPDS